MHLYLHVPFCARRCSYCDFAIAVRRVVPSDRYVAAVLAEWRGWQTHAVWQESPRVETIYFGGGTPSRLEPAAIERIVGQIRSDRTLAADAEVTLEANPEDVTLTAAAAWRDAGVNRVSLGVQSFDPAVLGWMHRTHGVAEIPAAVAALRRSGIAQISVDLIFGLPAALGRDWEADLRQALALNPDHVSLYGLTIEPHTPLARWADRGEVRRVDENRYASEYLVANQTLTAAGFEHYEVSNAARPGCRARHNSAYWLRAPFIGLGPSAHSGFGGRRQWNVRDWAAYEQAIAERRRIVGGEETLSQDDIALEEMYLGLRTSTGIPESMVADSVLDAWRREGWARLEPGRVRLTPEGWLRLDALVAATPMPRQAV